jgi:hypothetical protein
MNYVVRKSEKEKERQCLTHIQSSIFDAIETGECASVIDLGGFQAIDLNFHYESKIDPKFPKMMVEITPLMTAVAKGDFEIV